MRKRLKKDGTERKGIFRLAFDLRRFSIERLLIGGDTTFFVPHPPFFSVVWEASGSNPKSLCIAKAEKWSIEIFTDDASPPKGHRHVLIGM